MVPGKPRGEPRNGQGRRRAVIDLSIKTKCERNCEAMFPSMDCRGKSALAQGIHFGGEDRVEVRPAQNGHRRCASSRARSGRRRTRRRLGCRDDGQGCDAGLRDRAREQHGRLGHRRHRRDLDRHGRPAGDQRPVPGHLARGELVTGAAGAALADPGSPIESLKPGNAPPGAKDPVVQKAKGSGPISAPIQNFDGICLPFGAAVRPAEQL